MLLDDAVFTVVDLETTGGSRANDAIIEIGAVQVWRGEILSGFSSFVRPHCAIRPFVADLTGISDQMVADAPLPKEVLLGFTRWSEQNTIAAHNASFDVQFLRAGCERHLVPWECTDPVDTVKIAKRVLGSQVANHKLGTLAAYFDIPLRAHRALDDARATALVLDRLITLSGASTVEELTGARQATRR